MVERKSSKKKVVEKSVEASLWESANKLRGSVEPAEYNTLATLEQNAQTLYRHAFIDNIDSNNLPGGWRMGTLGEFCAKMTSGGTPSRTNNDYWNSKDYPWLKIDDVQNNFIFESEECISEAGLKNSSAKLISAGSVVMAMYGATAAQVGYLQSETTTNQATRNRRSTRKSQSRCYFGSTDFDYRR